MRGECKIMIHYLIILVRICHINKRIGAWNWHLGDLEGSVVHGMATQQHCVSKTLVGWGGVVLKPCYVMTLVPHVKCLSKFC